MRSEAEGAGKLLRFVGERLREARERRGLSKTQLARLADVDRGYIGEIEQGERNPTLIIMWHLARSCGVEVTYFLPPDPDDPQLD
jgi:transcriptional regulator with XRE-family HTH domain